eukprot:m.106657 g.106657  ORF g.106657 m.106657 type:complete len:627 (-) comp10598_c0_seq1:131-2011(-)
MPRPTLGEGRSWPGIAKFVRAESMRPPLRNRRAESHHRTVPITNRHTVRGSAKPRPMEFATEAAIDVEDVEVDSGDDPSGPIEIIDVDDDESQLVEDDSIQFSGAVPAAGPAAVTESQRRRSLVRARSRAARPPMAPGTPSAAGSAAGAASSSTSGTANARRDPRTVELDLDSSADSDDDEEVFEYKRPRISAAASGEAGESRWVQANWTNPLDRFPKAKIEALMQNVLTVLPRADRQYVHTQLGKLFEQSIKSCKGYHPGSSVCTRPPNEKDSERLVNQMLTNGYPKVMSVRRAPPVHSHRVDDAMHPIAVDTTAVDDDNDIEVVLDVAPPPPHTEATGLTANAAASASDEAGPASRGHFDCACCMDEFPWTDAVPCPVGHLFCKSCVASVVERAAFDIGSTVVKCFDTSECGAVFPVATLRKVLPADLYEQLINRQQDEALKSMENIFQCPTPDCGNAVCVEDPENFKYFACSKCTKTTCAKCKKPWKDHTGKTCEEVEDDTNVSARQRVEEAMTKAMLRPCASCGLPMQKEKNTCNKMTCRCGTLTCYLCLKNISGNKPYEHFCPHPRDPGKKCKKCKKCDLWPDPDDETLVAKAREKALAQDGHLLATKVAVGPALGTTTPA